MPFLQHFPQDVTNSREATSTASAKHCVFASTSRGKKISARPYRISASAPGSASGCRAHRLWTPRHPSAATYLAPLKVSRPALQKSSSTLSTPTIIPCQVQDRTLALPCLHLSLSGHLPQASFDGSWVAEATDGPPLPAQAPRVYGTAVLGYIRVKDTTFGVLLSSFSLHNYHVRLLPATVINYQLHACK